MSTLSTIVDCAFEGSHFGAEDVGLAGSNLRPIIGDSQKVTDLHEKTVDVGVVGGAARKVDGSRDGAADEGLYSQRYNCQKASTKAPCTDLKDIRTLTVISNFSLLGLVEDTTGDSVAGLAESNRVSHHTGDVLVSKHTYLALRRTLREAVRRRDNRRKCRLTEPRLPLVGPSPSSTISTSSSTTRTELDAGTVGAVVAAREAAIEAAFCTE